MKLTDSRRLQATKDIHDAMLRFGIAVRDEAFRILSPVVDSLARWMRRS